LKKFCRSTCCKEGEAKRASERENERESKISYHQGFLRLFSRGCKVQRHDSLMTHRVWNKSSIIIFVSHHQKSQRHHQKSQRYYYYQGAADMVLGLSWGQLALVLGASVALFGKVSSYDFVSSSGLTFRSYVLAQLFACYVYFRVQVVGLGVILLLLWRYNLWGWQVWGEDCFWSFGERSNLWDDDSLRYGHPTGIGLGFLETGEF
jgi:hypothetical protein